MNHPRHQLDDALGTALRYSMMAALADGTELSFPILRDALEADDSAVSKSMVLLEKAGYVAVRKGYANNRPRTWLSATDEGRAAFARHTRALQAIAAGAGVPAAGRRSASASLQSRPGMA